MVCYKKKGIRIVKLGKTKFLLIDELPKIQENIILINT